MRSKIRFVGHSHIKIILLCTHARKYTDTIHPSNRRHGSLLSHQGVISWRAGSCTFANTHILL